MTDAVLPALAALVAALVSPGPNNFIAFAAAARGGYVSAAALIAGMVAGSFVMLVLLKAGAGAAFSAYPVLRPLIALAGAAYLAWLGLRLILGAMRGNGGSGAASGLPDRPFGVFAFQFLNPKGWALILTVLAAWPSGMAAFAALAAIMIVLPAMFLSLWAAAGSALSRVLSRPGPAAVFGWAMGGLLVASAAGIAAGAVGAVGAPGS